MLKHQSLIVPLSNHYHPACHHQQQHQYSPTNSLPIYDSILKSFSSASLPALLLPLGRDCVRMSGRTGTEKHDGIESKAVKDPVSHFKRVGFLFFYALLCVFSCSYLYIFKDDARNADQNVRATLKSKTTATPHYSTRNAFGHVVESKIVPPPSISTTAVCFQTKTIVSDPSIVYGQYLVQKKANETTLLRDIFEIPPGQQTIVDLSHSYRCKAYYHRLVDCFVPSLCAFMQGISHPQSTFIVPSFLAETYGYFLGNNSGHALLPHNGRGGPESFGLRLPPNERITVVYPDWASGGKNRKEYFHAFREHLAEADLSQNRTATASHITLIYRHCTESSGTRCFKNTEEMLGRFAKGLDLEGQIYYGNESFQETVNLFARSRVVVGYHGAGLVNTLFCPSETVVLEYTTFHNMDGTRMWRTNEGIAGIHGSLKWLKHTIDIDRLTNLSSLMNISDTNHYIKGVRYVDVTGSTLYNSIESIKEILANQNRSKKQ